MHHICMCVSERSERAGGDDGVYYIRGKLLDKILLLLNPLTANAMRS